MVVRVSVEVVLSVAVGAVTPVGGVPLTLAVLFTTPASTSAWVMT